MAEERGFDCLCSPSTRTFRPRAHPFPAAPSCPPCCRTFDPFVACTAAAAATERLLIGTGSAW